MFDDVAPVIPVRDLDIALERYRKLGFEVRTWPGTAYGFATRDEVELHLNGSEEHDPQGDGAVVYLFVADAQAVYAEWTGAGVEGRFTGPRDTPWRKREFGYVDPDGTLHRVGSSI